MKYIFFLIFFTQVIFSQIIHNLNPYTQKNPKRWEYEQQLRKELKIKSQTIFNVKYDTNNIVIDSVIHEITKYDKNGRSIYFEIFDGDGKPHGYAEWTIDSLGNTIVSKEYRYINDQYKLTSKTIIHYTDFNLPKSVIDYNDKDSVTFTTDFFYNSHYKLEKEMSLSKTQNHIHTISYRYDDSDNMIFKIDSIYKLNENSSKIDTTFYNITDTLRKTIYNNKGNIIERIDNTHEKYERKVYKYFFYYDNNDNLAKEIVYENEKVYFETNTVYDASGLITNSEVLGKRKYRHLYFYEYY